MGRPNVHNLPEHLRKRSDGTFILDYVVTLEDGRKKRVIKTLGKIPKALAMKIRDKIMTEQAEGQYFRPKVPFRQAADAFSEYSRNRRRSHESDKHLVAMLVEHFGDRTLDSLSPDAVERFLNVIRERGRLGRPLAPATLNRYIACLKTIVNRALDNNLIERNPIRGVKLFKENNVRDRVLSQGEYQRLVKSCSAHITPMVILAYRTGMRRGEILGMRWDQLRLAERVILLGPEDTKTNEAREIPLDEELAEMLRRAPRVLGCPHVFTHLGKPIRDVKTAFNAACRRAGIQDFRFHDLRHCAVTNLRKAGISQNVIMAISGHKTASMLRRYDRVDLQDKQLAIEIVRKVYESQVVEAEKLA